MRISTLFFFVYLLLAAPCWAQDSDPTDYRFVFVGCNRVGFEAKTSDNPSTANIQQLRNTYREIARLDPKPGYFFFLGDLILGYTGYLSTVDQLQAWKSEFERSALADSGVTLVPVTGNHETLLSVQDSKGRWHDYPNPPAVKAWREELHDLLPWRDGPTTAAPNLDSLTSTQEDLSFTIKDHGVLFIVLNTDTFVDNITTGDIPLHWLQQKLQEGQADPQVKHIFVLGHKPLIKPDIEAWIIREDQIQPAIDLLNATPKVRAFLTAHYHLWDVRPLPGGNIPQIIAGNGGSPLKGPFTDPRVGYFGYTVVDLKASGDIVVESWGRPVPDPYWNTSPQPAATLRETRVIRAGH